MSHPSKLSDLGVLGFACLTSETWRDAIECLTRFQRLLEAGPLQHLSRVRHSVDRSAGRVVIRLEPRGELSGPELAAIMDQWVRQWQHWLQSSGVCVSVVNFSQIQLAGLALDTRLEMANAEVHAVLVEQCTRALHALEEKEILLEQVKREVEALSYQRVDSGRIAHRLRISARTVRRNLAVRGTSFHDVVMEQRMSLAKRYLRDPSVPIKQISSSLGYSDISSFHRAFRLQTGLTPGQFRGQSVSSA